MPMAADDIVRLIKEGIPDADVEIQDLVGDGDHYAATVVSAAFAGNYDTGATDTSIKLGQTMPYSGPASAYSAIGRAEIAYFKMLNDKGGINGRKVELLSMDDGYSPSKTVEQIRRLAESDEVLAMFSMLGTGPNIKTGPVDTQWGR